MHSVTIENFDCYVCVVVFFYRVTESLPVIGALYLKLWFKVTLYLMGACGAKSLLALEIVSANSAKFHGIRPWMYIEDLL